jgi:hypothetical protein
MITILICIRNKEKVPDLQMQRLRHSAASVGANCEHRLTVS